MSLRNDLVLVFAKLRFLFEMAKKKVKKLRARPVGMPSTDDGVVEDLLHHHLAVANNVNTFGQL